MNIEPIINGLASLAGAGLGSLIWNLRRKASPISAPVAAIPPTLFAVPTNTPSAAPVTPITLAIGAATTCVKCHRAVVRWTPTLAGAVCANCQPLAK